MTDIRNATIIGGGIAGPVAAMALRRAGIEATVYEAYPDDADGVGAALMVAPNGLNALRLLDIDLREIGIPTPRMTVYSGTGKQLAEFRELPGLPSAQTLDRADLCRLLREEASGRGISIESGKRLLSAEEWSDGVVAHFADGTQVRGDVLVGADGIHSTVRGLIDPAAKPPEYGGLCGFGSWVEDSGLESTAGDFRMIFGKRGFFGYLVSADGRALWFANISHPTHLSIADAEAIAADQWMETLRRTFAEDEGPALRILEQVRGEDLMTTGTALRLPTPARWSRGRMVIVGDAAHAASTSSGQGVSMAIESAIELARFLRDGTTASDAFAGYERNRRPRVEKVIAHGKRTENNKAPGPVGRVLRDLLLPPAMKLVAKPEKMAWLLAHEIEWEAPAVAGSEVPVPA